MDTLLNFSGGIDSAYCLYDYLRSGKRLLVHHIELISPEAWLRHKHEMKAVRDILGWLGSKGFKNYEYLETKIDFRALNRTCKDVDVVMFMTGILLGSPKRENITKIIMPNQAEDFGRNDYEDRSLRRFKIFEAMVDRKVQFLFPIKDMTKDDLRRAMPRELYDLVWYCRRPLSDGSTCDKCGTCKDVNGRGRSRGRLAM